MQTKNQLDGSESALHFFSYFRRDGTGMDPKILLQVLSLIIVADGGHILHRSNQIGSIKDDCKLKSIVSSIKEALGLAILENCLDQSQSLNGK